MEVLLDLLTEVSEMSIVEVSDGELVGSSWLIEDSFFTIDIFLFVGWPLG